MTRSRAGEDEDRLAIGVDVGGTWLRVVALDPTGRVVARGREPAPAARDLSKVLRATWRARGWSAGDVSGLVVASRGVWTAAERRAVTSRVGSLARRVEAISDVEAALLGALGERPGLLLLAGTGSIVLGRTPRGAWVRAGGLGPLLGDEGSGFWIGREWVRATATTERARTLARAPDATARIAALARGVIARAQRGAREERAIVRAAQEHLAALVQDVAARVGDTSKLDASWAGSLLSDAWFRDGVKRAVARRRVRVRWVAPASDAALAAAREALLASSSQRSEGIRSRELTPTTTPARA